MKESKNKSFNRSSNSTGAEPTSWLSRARRREQGRWRAPPALLSGLVPVATMTEPFHRGQQLLGSSAHPWYPLGVPGFAKTHSACCFSRTDWGELLMRQGDSLVWAWMWGEEKEEEEAADGQTVFLPWLWVYSLGDGHSSYTPLGVVQSSKQKGFSRWKLQHRINVKTQGGSDEVTLGTACNHHRAEVGCCQGNISEFVQLGQNTAPNNLAVASCCIQFLWRLTQTVPNIPGIILKAYFGSLNSIICINCSSCTSSNK